MYALEATVLFQQQAQELSPEGSRIILQKIPLLKQNPFRFKRIQHRGLPLFRIRFSDRGSEKRLIYAVLKGMVVLICILDRKHDYQDLEEYLRKAGMG